MRANGYLNLFFTTVLLAITEQKAQALEGRPVKSFFDFIGRTEATRGARRWSWIKITS